MNIFKEIEGLAGEDLITAILRILVLRSQEVRERFVSILSDHSRLGPIEMESHFSCILQHVTEDKCSNQWGRLDLLIETDNAVIGIENKLFADFQPGQPHKYLKTVETCAEGLKLIRQRGSFLHQVAVIAPRSRSKDVAQVVQDNQHLSFVPWEVVLEGFRSIPRGHDEVTQAVMSSFTQFLGEKIEFLPRFREWVPHLTRHFPDYGSQLQQRVVSQLWGLFPDGGRRLSNGKTWLGYYFCDTSNDHSAWFGYVPSKAEIAAGAKHEAELVIVTSFPLSLLPEDFRPITFQNSLFLGRGRVLHAWAVNYDQSWNTMERWRSALQSLNEQVSNLVATAEGGHPGDG